MRHTSIMATFLRLKSAHVLRQCVLLVCVLFIYFKLPRTNLNIWRFFEKATKSDDFRILVLTMNRAESLRTCLSHVNKLIVGDDGSITLDIWIDRAKNNSFDEATRRVATDFRWTVGPSSVHVQPRHAGVYGQWLDTWQPRRHGDNPEVALFVEDDVDVSPYAYRWLKEVHKFYAHRNDIAMFCLQDTNAVKMGPGGGEVRVITKTRVYSYQHFSFEIREILDYIVRFSILVIGKSMKKIRCRWRSEMKHREI